MSITLTLNVNLDFYYVENNALMHSVRRRAAVRHFIRRRRALIMHTVTYSTNHFYSYANPFVTVSCFGPLGRWRPPVQVETTLSRWSRCACFSPHPSAMAVFTSAQTNRTWGRNAPGFETNAPNELGVKTPLVCHCVYCIYNML